MHNHKAVLLRICLINGCYENNMGYITRCNLKLLTFIKKENVNGSIQSGDPEIIEQQGRCSGHVCRRRIRRYMRDEMPIYGKKMPDVLSASDHGGSLRSMKICKTI